MTKFADIALSEYDMETGYIGCVQIIAHPNGTTNVVFDIRHVAVYDNVSPASVARLRRVLYNQPDRVKVEIEHVRYTGNEPRKVYESGVHQELFDLFETP